jgi:lipopolysaccharide transport system ATP-binding protein
VGDAEFQKKAIGKMQDISQKGGRTVLFVSHNMAAVKSLCTRGVVMENGKVVFEGGIEESVSEYLNINKDVLSKKIYNKNEAPSSEIVRLLETEVINQMAENKSDYFINEKVGVRIRFEILIETDDLVLGLNLYNHEEIHILSSHQKNQNQNYKMGVYQTTVWLPNNFLSEGFHFCGVAAMSYKGVFKVHFHDINKFSFNIIDEFSENTARGIVYKGRFPGVVRPILDWDNVISLKD